VRENKISLYKCSGGTALLCIIEVALVIQRHKRFCRAHTFTVEVVTNSLCVCHRKPLWLAAECQN